VPVAVKRHGRRRVSEKPLHDLDISACADRGPATPRPCRQVDIARVERGVGRPPAGPYEAGAVLRPLAAPRSAELRSDLEKLADDVAAQGDSSASTPGHQSLRGYSRTWRLTGPATDRESISSPPSPE